MLIWVLSTILCVSLASKEKETGKPRKYLVFFFSVRWRLQKSPLHTLFPLEDIKSSSFSVYKPSLSKFVQKYRFSAVVASSTVVSPEMRWRIFPLIIQTHRVLPHPGHSLPSQQGNQFHLFQPLCIIFPTKWYFTSSIIPGRRGV